MEIRCSNLARPMICAGSLFFNLPPEPETQAAKEGTAAGELLRLMLEKKPIPDRASNDVYFDSDMKFFITPIAEDIANEAESEVLCETRIDWQTRSGIIIRGQYDVCYVKQGKLHVEDLKYGWGPVEVFENWQLIGYAIGEVIRRGQAMDIVFRIRQPRPHHEDGPKRTWELPYSKLLEFKERIEQRMEMITAGHKDLVTSPKCKYCPAAVACPAFNKAFYRGVEVVHEFLQDDISDQELSFQLDLIGRIAELVKIKQDSITTLATDRIKAGKIIPNYSTVENYGNRSWKDGVKPETIKTLTGIDVIKQEMVSPAQAEQLGIDKKFVNALVDRKFLGLKLKRVDGAALGNKIFGNTKPV